MDQSTLPQRMGLLLLAAYPDLVAGRVIDQDFRAVGTATLPGVVPGTTVEVRSVYGKINPLIVIDDQGPTRPLGTMGAARETRVAVWVFHPESHIATRNVLALRRTVDEVLDGAIDRLPDDHPHFPGEGTRGRISLIDGVGTISDGEAVYDRLLFRVAHTKPNRVIGGDAIPDVPEPIAT